MKKEKARKTKWVLAVQAIILIGFFILAFGFLSTKKQILGFVVYQSQPSPDEGKDTYIRQNSDVNFGTDTTLKIGKTATGIEFRPILEFNLSAVPNGVTITSAILQLYTWSSTGNATTVKVYRLIEPWNETEAGWNNRTSSDLWNYGFSPGGRYDESEITSVLLNQTGWYNFTILTVARGWLNTSYNNYGIILIASNANNGDQKEFYSSDYVTDSSLRPKLYIDYTENAPPSIENIQVNSLLPTPKKVGENVTFTISWSDLESNQAKLFICNSSSISTSNCAGRQLCNASFSSVSPLSCNYTIAATDNRTTSFFAAVCDLGNCSSANESYFQMNHLPTVNLVQPNSAGITINQSQGSYPVQFIIADSDSDLVNASIYYGITQYSTNSIVIENINTSATTTYFWNSTGIYGTYYLTIIINDTYHTNNDTSDNSFQVVSLTDNIPPNITAQWITDSYVYSGKSIQIYANVSDPNLRAVWVSVNITPQQNITMTNLTSATFNATFTAPAPATYSFKVYANDTIGNFNNSMPWNKFNVTKPSAASQNITAPAATLPFHVIKVTAELNATDSLRDIYAYLNIPNGFTFLTDYSQNSYLGNFSTNETKTATWFLSAPITESSYKLNVSYTDKYSNSWNSSNANISITSAIGGGYALSVSGYPEVETARNYYAEASFMQSGLYAAPDSVYLTIKDSTGTIVVGPVAMSQKSTGIYNYTYSVGSSVNEGLWETIVNATKSSTSYYANQFWKVVGGPFDVRNIVVNDNTVPLLSISVTAENTGGANKDLYLTWNLTRTDNNALLHSGADTIGVNASSQRVWTISPQTSYVGQVKITFLGTYSGTEKAGAYAIFSTTSASNETSVTPSVTSGGGGASVVNVTKLGKRSDFEIKADSQIFLTKNIEKSVQVEITNTGEKELTNIELKLAGLEKTEYTITPQSQSSLQKGKTLIFNVKIIITDWIGEKDFTYIVKANELTKSLPGKIIVLTMSEYFQQELARLKQAAEDLKGKIGSDEKLLAQLNVCGDIINTLENNIEKEQFIYALSNVKDADKCLSEIKIKGKIISSIYKNIWLIIGIIAALIMLVSVIIIIYLIYKKLNILAFFRNQEQKKSADKSSLKDKYFDEKIKQIEDKLKE